MVIDLCFTYDLPMIYLCFTYDLPMFYLWITYVLPITSRREWLTRPDFSPSPASTQSRRIGAGRARRPGARTAATVAMVAHPGKNGMKGSMDWFKGKSTGNHRFSH
jgi:hypothetical protein